MRRPWRLAVLAMGLLTGALSLAIARGEPGYSLGGASVLAGAAELLAGCALLVVGLIASRRPNQQRLGRILVAASFAWFLIEWNNPGANFAIVFTVGLVLYVAAPPLAAHAVLAYPDGRVRSWLPRIALAVAYGGAVLVLGVLTALVFDPDAEGCSQCPRNLLLVNGDRHAYESVNRVGVYLGLAWALFLILVALVELVRLTPARRLLAFPVVIPGCAYLGLVAAYFANGLDRGFLGNDDADRRLWLGQGAALCALSLGVTWGWVRARQTRSRVAHLVIELAGAPPPGGLRDALAATLDDPSLQLAYPLADGRLVDARGQSIQLRGEATPLVRGGHEVARLSHRQGLLDNAAIAEEVAAAGRLALENERLQAESRAQLDDLRASRARIIATGDDERRRLERDLHDGAQQRLVSLALALRLARSRLGSDPDPTLLARMGEADVEVREALAELRELAHGIFPAVLAEEGLAAALEALGEGAAIPVDIAALPDERLAHAVEAAGYSLASEMVGRSTTRPSKIIARRRESLLVVEVEADSAPEQIIELEDRVGAIDGSVEVLRESGGRVTIRAEIPCE